MKHTFDLQFRTAHPETVGETDLHNYVKWLECEYVNTKTKLKANDIQLKHNKALNIADVSHIRELLVSKRYNLLISVCWNVFIYTIF